MDLLLLGKEPIRTDQVTGVDVRYEPEFDALQAEIEKMSSPAGPAREKAVRLASEILGTKSKDLLVASYFVVAMIFTRQADGLETGLRVYSDLIENFWDELFPSAKRMRGRLQAIEWCIQKAEWALKQVKGCTLTQDQLGELRGYIEKIDQSLVRTVEDPPLLMPFMSFLESFAVSSDRPATDVNATGMSAGAVEERPVVRPAEGSAGSTGTVKEIESPQDARRELNNAFRNMMEVANYYWKEDISNPLLYRLDRAVIWLPVDALPLAKQGRTMIPPPSAQVMQILEDQRKQGDHEVLLRSAEEKLQQFIFWLDLNRLVSESLFAMGDRYQAAYDAVLRETSFFVQRLPGIEELAFSDGTPFADTETRQWLSENAPGGHASDIPSVTLLGSSPSGEEEDIIRQEVEEARKLIRKKKKLEAAERLQQKLKSSASEKERLHWRLAITGLFMQSGNGEIVLPHLEQILKDLDRYGLEEYDPPFALQCLKLVWTAYKSQTDQTAKGRAAEILQRIAKMDIAEVVRLEKS